jgi:hypothetical protein
MLVVTAVSSINTRRAGSSSPCSRSQRRRARATSARFRSAACRLFFKGEAVASKKSGERAAASSNSPLVQHQNELIQREVTLLVNESEDSLRVLLQRRSAPAAGQCLASPAVAKALHSPDRRTDADGEVFGCLMSGFSFLHEANDSDSQLSRIRSRHWSTLRRINAVESLICCTMGIPIQSRRDVL